MRNALLRGLGVRLQSDTSCTAHAEEVLGETVAVALGVGLRGVTLATPRVNSSGNGGVGGGGGAVGEAGAEEDLGAGGEQAW